MLPTSPKRKRGILYPSLALRAGGISDHHHCQHEESLFMAETKKRARYRFTFGPWNISTGRDPFGPEVRKEVAFAAKIREYKKLGFDGVQFHDDDVVEADLDPAATMKGVAKVKKVLEGEGLFCEFI